MRLIVLFFNLKLWNLVDGMHFFHEFVEIVILLRKIDIRCNVSFEFLHFS